MGITIATGKDLKRVKKFIGYDPRTGKTHPTPEQDTMEQGGNNTKDEGGEAEKTRQEEQE